MLYSFVITTKSRAPSTSIISVMEMDFSRITYHINLQKSKTCYPYATSPDITSYNIIRLKKLLVVSYITIPCCKGLFLAKGNKSFLVSYKNFIVQQNSNE